MANTTKAHEKAAGITVADLKAKLAEDGRWAKRAMLLIFEHQTADEQQAEDTLIWNGVGFSGTDAHLLTSYSKQYLKKKFLTEGQMKYVHKYMPKYAGQIVRYMAARNTAAQAAKEAA